MKQPSLLPLVREKFAKMMAGYIQTSEVQEVENYIVAPALNDEQGVKGCIRLALEES